MKKLIALFMTLALLLSGIAALAESDVRANDAKINCLIVDGSFIIQIDDPEGDLGWVADDMAQDDSVVKLYDADLIEDTFVVRYDPVGDGDVTVGVRHYTGIACDEAHTFDLRVENGAVVESTGGSCTASPDETEQDPYLSGEWLEQEAPFTQLWIEKNPERGWDVEIISPVTHGAYVFKTTIYYDCDLDAFVYDKGKFWDAPITDEEDAELGEAKVAGTTGSFTFTGDEQNPCLTWYNDQQVEALTVFQPADFAGETPGEDAAVFEHAPIQDAEETSDAAEAPSVEALTEGYFNVLANLEFGTAGASLKAAIAASEVCDFAITYDLYNPDVEALRANMLTAFESMSEDERAAFWEGFDAVNALLYDCLEDYEANRAVFEDAGVAETMDMVMYDPLNRLAWENLRDHTLSSR